MELLPPVGWADVATKEDLHHLESRLSSRIDVLGSDLRAEFHSTLRTNTFLLFGGMAALVGAATAITSLT